MMRMRIPSIHWCALMCCCTKQPSKLTLTPNSNWTSQIGALKYHFTTAVTCRQSHDSQVIITQYLAFVFFLSPQTTRRARWAPKIVCTRIQLIVRTQTRQWLHCCFYTSAAYKPIVGLGQYSWALWITLSEPIMFTSDRWVIVPGGFSNQNVQIQQNFRIKIFHVPFTLPWNL